MKEPYTTVELEVIQFLFEDIITSSPGGGGNNEGELDPDF